MTGPGTTDGSGGGGRTTDRATGVAGAGRDAMLALSAVAYVAAAALLVASPQQPLNRVALVQTFALFACGALIVRRTQTPLVGWLLVVPGVTFNLIYALDPMASAASTSPMTFLVPLANVGLMALALLPMVFPTGRLESATARVVATFGLLGLGAVMVGDYLSRLGVVAVSSETGFAAMTMIFGVVVVFGLIDQGRRYRRRPRVQQLQLKWFIVAIAGQLVYPAMLLLGVDDGSLTFVVLDNVATTLWPVTILVAILRFRLYEIDRLVSRTVAYTVVVVVLAVVFVGGVAGVTSLVPRQDRLAVAVTTVAAVALFNPLRRRVIDRVDRRFDRTRYVARQVVEGFGRDVRDVTDLDEISGRVHAVVSRTVAPTTVAVWQPRTEAR